MPLALIGVGLPMPSLGLELLPVVPLLHFSHVGCGLCSFCCLPGTLLCQFCHFEGLLSVHLPFSPTCQLWIFPKAPSLMSSSSWSEASFFLGLALHPFEFGFLLFLTHTCFFWAFYWCFCWCFWCFCASLSRLLDQPGLCPPSFLLFL